MNTVWFRTGLPVSRGLNLPPIPSPTTCRRPATMVWLRIAGLPRDTVFHRSHPSSGPQRHLDFALWQQARHDDRPNRVRHPTDWTFTSHCSPPALAGTQLCLVTEFKPNSGRDLHPADSTRLQARCHCFAEAVLKKSRIHCFCEAVAHREKVVSQQSRACKHAPYESQRYRSARGAWALSAIIVRNRL
jgi:hypothetical protein